MTFVVVVSFQDHSLRPWKSWNWWISPEYDGLTSNLGGLENWMIWNKISEVCSRQIWNFTGIVKEWLIEWYQVHWVQIPISFGRNYSVFFSFLNYFLQHQTIRNNIRYCWFFNALPLEQVKTIWCKHDSDTFQIYKTYLFQIKKK